MLEETRMSRAWCALAGRWMVGSVGLALGLSAAWARAAPEPAAPAAGEPAPGVAGSAGGAQTLQTVKVTAPAISATSEGTGSYTTDATNSATGLTLSLRDTPQSVTVITRQRMDDQAMATVGDALRSTIGISVKPFDRARNGISARGFDITNYQLDGAPMANGNIGLDSANAAMFDRVEIVRGATGLLNGAGDPSASVNMARKHATSKVFTGDVQLEAGSWNQLTGTVDLTTPLVTDGSIRARVVAQAGRKDYFIDYEESRNTLVYAAIDADLGPKTRLSLGASHQREERDGVMWASLPYWNADGSRTDWPRSKSVAARWNRWNTTDQWFFASLSHELDGGWVARADATYHHMDEFSHLLWTYEDPSGSGHQVAYPYRYISVPSQSHVSASLTGPFRLFGRQHQLHVGAMASRAKDGWDNSDPVDPTPTPVDLDLWDGSFAEPAMGERYVASRGRVTQSALYAVTRLQVSDQMKLIIGARLSQWQRKDEAAVWQAEPSSQEERNVVTPYAGLVFDLTDSLSAYASFTDIFKPQTNRAEDRSILDPLRGHAWEAGVKAEWFDGRLNAAAALFGIRQKNFAVAAGVFPGTQETFYRAADGVKSSGFEVSLAGELAKGWQVDVGYTQFKARDADGNDVNIDHARRQFKLFTRLDVPQLPGFSLGGGVSWEGAKPSQPYANPGTGLLENTAEGAITLVDLMASYEIDRHWSLQLNVNNLLDRKYRYTSFWGPVFTYGEPRRVVGTVRYAF